ncbi:uncharacterized protein LOC127858127 isoform X2 [Dreissena polymorpha]|uniref:uncharacterized protein LOC127858127 isoform X2 n=1 Tax=Dreissena polymorpha TaxID=45954 RepID=UPI002264782A|nr:uncharacterized protein LOC127858127 isoform X2 [Dreissena polymorpha]
MEGLINILMCSIYMYAHIFYCAVSSDPLLNVRIVHASKLELSCSDNIDSYGTSIWNFYSAQHGKQEMQNMAKIEYSGSKCTSTYMYTIKSMQCECTNHTGVLCNISGDGIANTGDRWKCSKFINGSVVQSNILTLPSLGQVSSEQWFYVRVLCSWNLELSCSGNIENYGTPIWIFYRSQQGKQDMQNMVKIEYSGSECKSTYLNTIKSRHCECLNYTGVICNISGDGSANAGDRWQCAKFTNGSVVQRQNYTLPSQKQENSDCTTVSVTQTAHDDETTYSTRSTNDKVTVLALDANHTTSGIGNTSTATNSSDTNTSNNDESARKLAFVIAGPFVVFGIGIVLFISRKKVLSALKRAHGRVDDLPVNINDMPPADDIVNIAAGLNNITWSNIPSSSTETDAVHCVDGRNAAGLCFNIGDLQPGCTEYSNDDPLYSSVNEPIVNKDADASIERSGKDHVHEDTSFHIPIDDDPLYSCVKLCQPHRTDEGACGFSAEGNDDQLHSILRAGDLNKSKHNPFYSNDNDNIPLHVHESNGNLQYRCTGDFKNDTDNSVVKENELYSLAKNIDPVYSTATMKGRNCVMETSNGVFEFNAADPLYSVVDKSKSRGGMEFDWNRTAPSFPECTSLVVPLYSKVNKKIKKAADKTPEDTS